MIVRNGDKASWHQGDSVWYVTIAEKITARPSPVTLLSQPPSEGTVSIQVFFIKCQLIFPSYEMLPARPSEGGVFKSCNSSEALALITWNLALATIITCLVITAALSTAKGSLLCTGREEGASAHTRSSTGQSEAANRHLLKSGQAQNCKLIPESDCDTEQMLWIWPDCSAEKGAIKNSVRITGATILNPQPCPTRTT